MNTNPLKTGVLTENSSGIGTVTRKMVRERAVELSLLKGHTAQEVSKTDWEQAKRELTGIEQPDMDPKELALDSATEAERWDPVPGSEDEDDEGRSDNTRLTEEGISEAEHDQMRQASQSGD